MEAPRDMVGKPVEEKTQSHSLEASEGLAPSGRSRNGKKSR